MKTLDVDWLLTVANQTPAPDKMIAVFMSRRLFCHENR